ncbi:MAG: pseudouridine synthase [Gammaproteobacteria bacterium]|nr:pseudouridine synthase [Gammaproteobacteria bacterium]
MMERIQKVLAHHGAGSRRQIDKLLQEGRIKVNGKVAKPGDQLQGGEKVSIDDKLVRFPRHIIKPKLLMYHKPVGLVSTRSDPQGRPTVYGQLPKLQQGRWIGVGRLDINTSGLLLFTTNGELANRLMHPSFEVEREYAVRVRGEVTDEKVANLTSGIELDDGMAKFDLITDGGGQGTNHWYHVTLREGKNREVRRLWEAVDVEVSRLVRVRYFNFTLPKWLKPGKTRFFDDDVVVRLFESLELEYPAENKNKILKAAKAQSKTRHGRRK